MNMRTSLAIALLLWNMGEAGEPSLPGPRLKGALLSDLSHRDSVALEVDPNEEVLVNRMTGLVLVGSLGGVEKRPSAQGVVCKDLSIPGSEAALVAKLEPLIVGKPLTQKQISLIKREIITHYQENNRPVVAVIVPEQDVTDGVLQIGVIQGRIGEVITTGGKWFSADRMQRMFHLVSGEEIDSDRLLSDLSWVNQTPFRQSNIVFSRGKSSGTTDVEVVTNDRYPLRVYAGGDNTGNHFIGRNRWYTGFNWGDVFGWDQTLSFQYTTSSDFQKFQGYTLNYKIPLPWHNTLIFFGGYSRVNPSISHHMGGDGWSGQASMRYIIPFGKTYGNFLQNFQAGYDFKATNNSIEFNGGDAGSKVAHVNQFLGSYYMGWTQPRHKMNGDIDLYVSPGNWFGSENKKAFNTLEKDANPSYVYTRLAFGDEMTFSKYDIGLYMLGRAQFASRTLVPSEQYGLGGYDTVRGYEQRVVSYDDAICFNFEVRAPSFSILKFFGSKYREDSLVFLAFLDYGVGWPHGAKGDDSHDHLDPKSQTLLGVGPGLRYKIGPWFYARVDYGVPLTDVNDKGFSPVLDFGLLCSY